MTLKQMLERREAIRAEMTTIHGASNGAALAPEAETRWAALAGELATLDGATTRQAQIDDLDRRAALGAPLGDARFEAESRAVGILDVVRAQLRGANDAAAGRAREVSAELARRSGRAPQGLLWPMQNAAETRALTSGAQGTAPNGAALVPNTLRADLFVDRLRNATVVRALGATVIGDLNGNVDIPRRTDSVGASWFNENTPIPMTEGAYDKVTLRPKHVGALTELSLNMVQQNSPDVEALTQKDMARTMAEAVDAAALYGSGNGTVPLGVVNTPGVGVVSFANGAPKWGGALGLVAAVETGNSGLISPGFVASGAVRAAMMGTERGVGSNGFVMQEPGILAGYRFASTNSLPVVVATTGANATPALSTMIFADWSDLLIGIWSTGLDLSVNEFAEGPYSRGGVLVRAILTADVAVRHAASFAVGTNISTANALVGV